MADHRFLHAMRLVRGADFERVYQRRCTAGNNLILVFAACNSLDHPRLGLSVSRKVGGAVRRNRCKRLIREAFRLSHAQLPKGIDLVVIPRADAELTLRALLATLPKLAAQAARRATQAASPSANAEGTTR